MIPTPKGDDRPSPLSSKSLAEVFLEHNLLEMVPDAMVVADAHGGIVQVNSQTVSLFGYEREELIGKKVELLVPQRYREQHQVDRSHFVHAPRQRRMGVGLQLFGRRKNGSEFPVEISLSPIQLDSGVVVLAAIRDVEYARKIEADLRRANRELKERTAEQIGEYRDRLAAIIDSSDDAIIGKTLDGTITSWNLGAERMYGYTAEEMVGENIRKLTTPEGSAEIAEILEKLSRGEKVERLESVRLTRDGRRLHVSVTVSPLLDANGRVVGASAIARDMTAQKRAEDQLRNSQKLEAVGRLAGGVAHDFNNILGIVTACAELIRDRVPPEHEALMYLENIQKAIGKGAALTRQLLMFSRRQAVSPRVIDLNERLAEFSKLLGPLMGDDVQVKVSCKAKEALVEADPGHLDQIVMNLAVNARDAMPQGGQLILETSLVDLDDTFVASHHEMKPGPHVVMAVSDTGEGMDEATRSRIFEPFFTTKEPGKGTGLGLSTVYGIVQQSGGYISVYSEPGLGTTFKVYLRSAASRLDEAPREQAGVEPQVQGKTVLLVEDNELMRRATRELLERDGYNVLDAADARQALEIAKSAALAIDLLLTDVMMHGISGPELALKLQELIPGLKTVFMSGYTGELIAERAALNPETALLEKPFTRSELLSKLKEAF